MKYSDFRHKKFVDWQNKVRKRLPEIVIYFYTITDRPKGKEKLLGRIIAGINDPLYDFKDEYGKRYSKDNIFEIQIILQLMVEDFFKFISTEIKQKRKK